MTASASCTTTSCMASQLPPFIDSGFDLLTTPEQAAEFAEKWETQNFVPEGGSPFGVGDASAYTS